MCAASGSTIVIDGGAVARHYQAEAAASGALLGKARANQRHADFVPGKHRHAVAKFD